MHRNLGCVLLAAALVGCFGDSERDERWDRERTVIGPIAVKDRLAYVDVARDRVVTLDAEDGSPTLKSTAIGRNAVFAKPTPDGDRLAVLSRGQEARFKGQEEQEPRLSVVDLSPGADAVQSYSIGSPFDRLALSSDGSTAVAYFSSGGFDSTGGVFRNPNELAIVDLESPPSESNPVLRTVRSFGEAPDGVVLSPPMVIPGAEDDEARIFAFVLAAGTVTVLDATNPERREVSIRLGESADGGMVHPKEIVFAPNSAAAYLNSQRASDVLQILLAPEEQENEQDNDYQPFLAELGAGAGPSDIEVYDDALGRRFVLASMPSRRQVALINGDTSEFITVDTPDPIDRIMLFPDIDGVAPKIALLASISSGLPRVHLLGLEGIAETLVPIDLRTVNLSEPVLDVVSVASSDRAMIVHDADRTVLGLLDVTLGSVSPLEGVGRLDTFDFTGDGNHLVGATSGLSRVGFLDLDSLHPSDLRIDDAPSSVHAMSSGAIFIDHGDPFGRATYLPHPGASRSEAAVLSGFLLHDYLDESNDQ